MSAIAAAKARYESWWVGKKCRLAGCRHDPFRLVTAIDVYGSPSFSEGGAELIYEDGTHQFIARTRALIPRKYDVEIEPTERENKAESK